MSADIFEFPKSKKQLELEAMRQYVDNAKKAISKNIVRNFEVPNILGIPVDPPENRAKFLKLCKEFLEPEDYQDILCGILDKEHYDALELPLQKIINSYYSFPR